MREQMIVEIVAPIRGSESRQDMVDVSQAPLETTVVPHYYHAQRGSEVRAHLLVNTNKIRPQILVILQCEMMTLPKDIIDEHIIHPLIANELTHLDKDDEARISLPLPTT